jgi:hypothetical protein
MNSLNKDEILLLAMKLDSKSLINFYKCNKYINKLIYLNESFWRCKFNQDFPHFSLHEKTHRERYLYLSKILTKEKFEETMHKANMMAQELNVGSCGFREIYDLLYARDDGERVWGLIWCDIDMTIHREFETINYLTGYTYGSMNKDERKAKTYSFLNGIRKGKFIDEIKECWINFNDSYHERHLSFENYINFLINFENLYQENVIVTTANDVREEIKTYLSGISNDPERLCNNDQIELFQILHDGINARKIGIFDPLDYDILMSKLTSQ